MEFPHRVIAGQRALAAALMLFVLAIAWREQSSRTAAALRQEQPWLTRISVGATPQLFLLLIEPRTATADIIYTPATRRSLCALSDMLNALPSSSYRCALELPEGEPPVAARHMLLALTQGPLFWKNIVSALRSPMTQADALTPLDHFILGLELHRLHVGSLHTAFMPEPADAEVWLRERISPSTLQAQTHARSPLTVEVLNGTPRKGIAALVTKVLRLKGIDVVAVGTAPPREHTIVYDRTGRFDAARVVRDRLHCPQAEVVTQIDFKRVVDATIVLGSDYPEP